MIGLTVTVNGEEWTVHSYAFGGTNYVYLARPSEKLKDRSHMILRPTALVSEQLNRPVTDDAA